MCTLDTFHWMRLAPTSPQSELSIKNDEYHLKHAFGSFEMNYI